MSRADELRAKYEAELAVIQLEDELVAAKEAGADGPDYVALKLRLRQARQQHRAARDGGAAASPAAIKVSADVISREG